MKKLSNNTRAQQTLPASLLLTVSAILIVITLSIANVLLYYFPESKVPEVKAVSIEETDPQRQNILSWKKFLQKHPDYIPGWLVLADLVAEKDKDEEAKLYVERAYEINPNSENVLQYRTKYFLIHSQ